MKIQVCKFANGRVDFFDSIVINDGDPIPSGYIRINADETNSESSSLKYKTDGTKMSQQEIDEIRNKPAISEMDEVKQQIADINLVLADMMGA
jgi:hypothetical protein